MLGFVCDRLVCCDVTIKTELNIEMMTYIRNISWELVDYRDIAYFRSNVKIMWIISCFSTGSLATLQWWQDFTLHLAKKLFGTQLCKNHNVGPSKEI